MIEVFLTWEQALYKIIILHIFYFSYVFKNFQSLQWNGIICGKFHRTGQAAQADSNFQDMFSIL
jgi:hypothetical protein